MKLLFLVLTFAVVSPASAETIVFSGSFVATETTNPLAGIPTTFSGTWTSHPFDTSIVPASGFFNVEISLASLAFSPAPYSAYTEWSPANTLLQASFQSGALTRLTVAGALNGYGIGGGDDFWVVFERYGGFARWDTAFVAGYHEASGAPEFTGSANFPPVPEPGSLGCLALGLLALGRGRKSLRR